MFVENFLWCNLIEFEICHFVQAFHQKLDNATITDICFYLFGVISFIGAKNIGADFMFKRIVQCIQKFLVDHKLESRSGGLRACPVGMDCMGLAAARFLITFALLDTCVALLMMLLSWNVVAEQFKAESMTGYL